MRTVLTRLIACLVFAALPAPALAERVLLRFVYEDRELFPYYMGVGASIPEQPGLVIEMVRLLATQIPELDIGLQRMPWRRCLNNLQSGEADALIASYSDERRAIGHYPMRSGRLDEDARIDSRSYFFYAQRGSEVKWDGQKLSGTKRPIGAPYGYAIVDDLKRGGHAVEESPSTLNDFGKLALGRIGAVAAQEAIGDFYLRHRKHNFASQLVKLSPPIGTKNYYLMLSHQFAEKHPELAAKIWRVLREIRDKQGDAIFARYLLREMETASL